MLRVMSGLVALVLLSGAAQAIELSAADRAAALKAAGFQPRGDQYIRCDDTAASAMPGSIEVADLNGDGLPEAWVKESSTFCYGNTAEAFVLVTKSAEGAWIVLLDQVGIAVEHDSRHLGWPDIEVGGPGFDKFPVYRFDGKTYVLAQ
jgi:hypothetical protein